MSDKIFNSLLTHSCSIYRRTFTSTPQDKWGASTEALILITSNESCLFQTRNEFLEFNRRGEKLYTRLLVFMQSTANVQEDDILVFNEKRFSVLGVEDAAGQGHHLELYVVNLENT